MKNEKIIEKYKEAKEIYILQRSKKLNGKEKAFDWLIALISPLPGVVSEADMVADLGSYYLAVMSDCNLLVRAEKEEITDCVVEPEEIGKKFVVNNNCFKKVMKIYG